MLVGVFLDRGEDLVDRRAGPHRRAGGLQPTVERVGVPVTEGRHEEPAVEIDCLAVYSSGLLAGLVAQRADHAVDHQKGIGLRTGAGPYQAAGEQGCTHLTTAVAAWPTP